MRLFLIFFLGITSLLYCLDTNNNPLSVIRKSERKQLLDGFQKYLDLSDKDLEKVIANTQDPFDLDRKKESNDPTVPLTGDEVYDDFEVIQCALYKLRPSGVVIRSDARMLVFPNGDTLKQGDIFKFRIKNTVYPIQLSEVTQKSYKFKRHDAELEELIQQPEATKPKQPEATKNHSVH